MQKFSDPLISKALDFYGSDHDFITSVHIRDLLDKKTKAVKCSKSIRTVNANFIKRSSMKEGAMSKIRVLIIE